MSAHCILPCKVKEKGGLKVMGSSEFSYPYVYFFLKVLVNRYICMDDYIYEIYMYICMYAWYMCIYAYVYRTRYRYSYLPFWMSRTALIYPDLEILNNVYVDTYGDLPVTQSILDFIKI